MSNCSRTSFVLLVGLLLAPMTIAADAGRTWPQFWGLFGIDVTSGEDEVGGEQQNPLYSSERQDEEDALATTRSNLDNPSHPQADTPSCTTQNLTVVQHTEPPVLPDLPPVVEKLSEPVAMPLPQPESKIQNDPAPDLFASRIDQFASANVGAYEKAKKDGESDKNPLVFHITTKNPSDYWMGLINLGIDRNEMTPADLMWIIHQHVQPSSLEKHLADQLYYDAIIGHLKGSKAAKITKLLTDVSITPVGSVWSPYKKSEKFNVLVNMMELGYWNPAYTKSFKEIVDLLPADAIANYTSVTLTENKENVTHSLASWINTNNEHYIVKNHLYAIDSAVHVFRHRLKHNAAEGVRDLPAHFVKLATILLREKRISPEEYGQASTRFVVEQAAKSE